MIIPNTPKIELPPPFGSMEFAVTPEGVACNSDRGSFLLPQEVPLRVVNISLEQGHLDMVKDAIEAVFKNSVVNPAFLFVENFAKYFHLTTRLSAWHFVSTPTNQAPKKDLPPMNTTPVPTETKKPFITFEEIGAIPGSRLEPAWQVKTHLGDFKIAFGPTLIQNETLNFSEVTRLNPLTVILSKFRGLKFTSKQRQEVRNMIAYHFGLIPHGGTFIPFGTAPARVDAEGTAKPKSRIVHHPKADDCQGPGMALKNPEYEQEGGTRIPLKATKKTNKGAAIVYSANNGKTAKGLFFHEQDAIAATLDSDGNRPSGSYVIPIEVWGTLASWKAEEAAKEKEAVKARALSKLTLEEREVLREAFGCE